MTGAAARESIAPGPPPIGTVERWVWDFVLSDDEGHKLSPPLPPPRWEADALVRAGHGAPPARRIARPGRPRAWRVAERSAKTPRPGALKAADRRAQLFHSFLHHELQAAELLGWALLAFPDTPRAFRRGLLRILLDEVRHVGMYEAHLRELGHRVGDFPVRDWFWERVPSAPSPAHFVATLGIGFEGGNLDHATRFAARLRAAGDERGARLSEKVAAEEIGHVRFALRWFERWTGGTDFERWAAHLPPPLSPLVMRGDPLDTAARLRAGLSADFVEALGRFRGHPGPRRTSTP